MASKVEYDTFKRFHKSFKQESSLLFRNDASETQKGTKREGIGSGHDIKPAN